MAHEPKIVQKGTPSSVPSVYVHGKIHMASEMITDKAMFVRLWGRTKGINIDDEWKLAKKWKDSFDKKDKGAK